MSTLRNYLSCILFIGAFIAVHTHSGSVEDRNGNPVYFNDSASISNDLIRRLTLQHRIDWELPFSQAMLIATHNSYSSPAYGYKDAYNHEKDITAQLNAGVRVINLDVIQSTLEETLDPTHELAKANDILVCHGVQLNTCFTTGRRYLYEFFAEIRRWIDKNPNEVIVIDFEEALNHAEHNRAVSLIKNSAYLGGKYFKPGDLGIWDFRDLSKSDIAENGKNIVFTCTICKDTPASWDSEVFVIHSDDAEFNKGNDWHRWQSDYPEDKFAGVYESAYDKSHFSLLDHNELLWLSHYRNYNIIGLDNYLKFPRINALVWSWADGYPKSQHECAMHSNITGLHAYDVYDEEVDTVLVSIEKELSFLGGIIKKIVKSVAEEQVTSTVEIRGYESSDFWKSVPCGTVAPVACAEPGDEGFQTRWDVSSSANGIFSGYEACAAMGMVFRSPQSAFENRALTIAKEDANVSEVLINYRRTSLKDESWKVADKHELPRSALVPVLI